MSDLFDEYPLLVAGLEILIPLLLVLYIVLYMRSGRKQRQQRQRTSRRPD